MNAETLRRVMTHLSSLGASKGGLARAASLTPEERSAIARRAAQARWERVRETQRQEYAEAQRSEILSEYVLRGAHANHNTTPIEIQRCV